MKFYFPSIITGFTVEKFALVLLLFTFVLLTLIVEFVFIHTNVKAVLPV